MEILTILRGTAILATICAVVFAQHHQHTYQYYQPDTNDYQYHYTPQFSSKSSNYFDHYNNKDYFYHNLTGYPQPGQSINADYNNRNDVEYDYDYYNYNNYAQEPIPEPTKKTGIVAPHPAMVALQNFLHGIQSRQFDLGGIFSGNTIYLVISIVLGIIGVGGLVFQWAQSFIDQWLKDITDLQSRVASLETTVASLGSSSVPQSVLDDITTLQTDVTAQTTKVTALCTTVTEITMVAGADAADAYATALEAINDPTC